MYHHHMGMEWTLIKIENKLSAFCTIFTYAQLFTIADAWVS